MQNRIQFVVLHKLGEVSPREQQSKGVKEERRTLRAGVNRSKPRIQKTQQAAAQLILRGRALQPCNTPRIQAGGKQFTLHNHARRRYVWAWVR
eukprot:1150539-Pelagomonas_calceolata.AAC.3